VYKRKRRKNMKKKISLIFGILLMAFLLIPNTKVFAEGTAQDYATGEEVTKLSTVALTTGDDKDFKNYVTYSINVASDPDSSNVEVIFPMTISQKGILNCASVYLDSNPTTSYGDFGIYSDAACTNPIDYNTYDYLAVIPKKGTYYFKFSVSDYSDEKPEDGYYFGLSSNFLSGADRALKDKTWSIAGSEAKKPIYYKITTTKAGSLTINLESDYSNTITLLNSSKKAISDETTYYSTDSKASYAVGKGTYYVKVTSNSDLYRIKSTFKAVTDTSGTTKAKAKKLPAGKASKGLVLTSDKAGKVDWYKFTLTKSQTVDITFLGDVSSGVISLELYGSGVSGSVTSSINTVDSDQSFSVFTTGSSKLSKGTYYIKITKKTKNTSGSYTLQFN
jgi:hypothetical protein